MAAGPAAEPPFSCSPHRFASQSEAVGVRAKRGLGSASPAAQQMAPAVFAASAIEIKE
jgi:hypothetical protein